jgi:hypothetical protein
LSLPLYKIPEGKGLLSFPQGAASNCPFILVSSHWIPRSLPAIGLFQEIQRKQISDKRKQDSHTWPGSLECTLWSWVYCCLNKAKIFWLGP